MDIAVVVNLKARRGTERVARACRAALPDARILASRSLDEALGFARELEASPPDLLLSAGGDGTAVALLNAMRGALATDDATHGHPAVPTLGVLPLGTGNGWARATGAPRLDAALLRVQRVAFRGVPLPRRRFDLVEVAGTVAHFAGTGWDAELIDDFHAQKTSTLNPLSDRMRAGLPGYLYGLFSRTIPRNVRNDRVEVELVNTGADAMTVDASGRAVPLPGGERGSVLYRGPASVCAAGTSPEWGFGFRSFPFAGLVPRRFCMRIYAGTALEATMRMGQLWRGQHPLDKMHTWMLTRCRATFSRPVPFQIGGDRLGHLEQVEYALAHERIDIVDWRRLARPSPRA